MALLVAACGGQSGENAQAGDSVEASESALVAVSSAEQGAELFQSRGCVGCHRIGGGRLVGPDLADVTERRSDEWLIAMITRPDSMLRVDDAAKNLLQEYLTPMPNQRLTRVEAESVLEYIRRQE